MAMKKILLVLGLLSLASCTRDVVLVLPPVPPRLVLNASVSPDTDVTAFLSKSWFVLDTVTDDGVGGSNIQVFINDRLQGHMQLVPDSRLTGRYILPGCRVKAGDRLRFRSGRRRDSYPGSGGGVVCRYGPFYPLWLWGI